MNCPKCKQSMQSRTIGGTTIDECPQCRGIWFDPGKIDEVKNKIDPDLRWMDFRIWRKRADFKVVADPLFCPRCADTALTAVAERQSGTVMRFCALCGGAWLKREDFEKIIDALAQEAENRTASDYIKESLQQAADLFAGEKDLISEWKDLKAVLRLLKYRVFIENPKLESIMKGLQKTLPL